MALWRILLAFSCIGLFLFNQSSMLPLSSFAVVESSNPNISADFPLTISNSTILDENNQAMPAAITGQKTTLLLTIQSSLASGEATDYIVIVEIRDKDGVTNHIDWKVGQTGPGTMENVTFSWIPESTDQYVVKSFLISSFESPEILSSSSSSIIKVVGSREALEKLIVKMPIGNEKEHSSLDIPVSNENSTGIGVPGKKVDYTVLIYMVASNLEANGYFATKDLEEMMAVGSSPNVNVIVQTGGGSENSTIDDYRFVDFTKTQRHLVLKDELQLIDDLGQNNMGDSRTLSQFLSWGISTYPADKYAVIFWDDGAGLRGFGFDQMHYDALMPDEIGDSFLKVPKFELIGFDACVMASIEVASSVQNHGKYMVASEELEPGWGWDYTAIVQSLVDNPNQDGKALGKVIVDSYFASARENSDEFGDFSPERGLTLSIIDLGKIKDLTSSLDIFSRYLASLGFDLDTTYKLTKTIKATERYGVGGSESSGHLDVYDFAEKMQANFPDIDDSPRRIMQLVQDAVVYKVNGDVKPNAHGISIYMQIDDYEPNASYLRYIVGSWGSVLEHGRKKLAEDVKAPELFLSKQNGYTSPITGTIKAKDLDTVELIITQKTDPNDSKIKIISAEYLMPSTLVSERDGSIDFMWSQEITSLCNNADSIKGNCQPTGIYIEENGVKDFAYIPVRMESEEGYNGTLILIYEVTDRLAGDREFSFIGGWPGIDDDGSVVRDLVPLTSGDKIYTYSLELDFEDSDYYKQIENEAIIVGDDFGPAYHSYSGTYDLYVDACDYSDNCNVSQDFEYKVE